VDAFAEEPAILAMRDFPSEAGQPVPRVKISIVEGALRADAEQLATWLHDGEPGVVIGVKDGAIYINPQTLQPRETHIVIHRLKEAIDFFK
jgi:L-seryl-tRNA(Ser) seleniumtransferase